MQILAVIFGILLTASLLWDAFQTIALPRSVSRRYGLTGVAFVVMALIWRRFTRPGARGARWLGAVAPVFVALLFASWGFGLVVAWSFIHWGSGTLVSPNNPLPTIGDCAYFSGTTLFTLGYGDMTPISPHGKLLAVLEAGIGLGFLALILSFYTVLYSAFSRRENMIMELDARAGSQPRAVEMMVRYGEAGVHDRLAMSLRDWEKWCSELMESFMSFPIVAYYRSHHQDQSWLEALTVILDVCALIEAGLPTTESWQRHLKWQAQATFRMGRHLLVDIAWILRSEPTLPDPARLCKSQQQEILEILNLAGWQFVGLEQLTALRESYEPFSAGLADEMAIPIPGWFREEGAVDHWQITAWDDQKHFITLNDR